jgi:hypothetical protein
MANLPCTDAPILAAYWIIASCYGCITAPLQEQPHDASPQQEAVLPTRGRSRQFYVTGRPHILETNTLRWELIRRGNPMLHLYFAAFGAVAANIIAVIAIAPTIRRDRSRFWPLWLWPKVPK